MQVGLAVAVETIISKVEKYVIVAINKNAQQIKKDFLLICKLKISKKMKIGNLQKCKNLNQKKSLEIQSNLKSNSPRKTFSGQ